jgi:hypothetical protein
MIHKKIFVVSIDLEAKGKTPVLSNCPAVGVACFDHDEKEVYAKEWFLKDIEGLEDDPGTVEWANDLGLIESWGKNAMDPMEAFRELGRDLKKLREQCDGFIWVGHPAGFDWQWFNALYHRMLTHYDNPDDVLKGWDFPYSCHDINSILLTIRVLNDMNDKQGDEYFDKFVSHIEPDHAHPILDARRQGLGFIRMLQDFCVSKNECETCNQYIFELIAS